MKCPRCGSSKIVKAGFVVGEQRYKCKDCKYFFTINSRSHSPEVKRIAVHLYLENYSLKSIGEMLGVSDVAIYKWIKKYGPGLSLLRKAGKGCRQILVDGVENCVSGNSVLYDKKWLLLGFGERHTGAFEILNKEN